MNAREFHVGCHRSGGGIPVLGASRRRGFMYKFPLAPPSRVRAKVAVYPEYNESERDNPSETSPHEGAFPSLGNFFGGRGQMRTNNYCSETRKRMSLEVVCEWEYAGNTKNNSNLTRTLQADKRVMHRAFSFSSYAPTVNKNDYGFYKTTYDCPFKRTISFGKKINWYFDIVRENLSIN
ncbi:hypothetical protein V1478_013011 [Vespula squamosa]|uniref:Uncharacterized protein n=1 Tax=Vespula squamosa TaxID=30214 RepID=A0ABD2A9K8_VESSQ